MSALVAATRKALDERRVSTASDVEAIALDTTGSSVIPVDDEPRAARRLLSLVRSSRQGGSRARSPQPRTREKLEAIEWCGGVYSSEWGFAKLLHWLRHNPEKRARFATALEHCDMVAAVLCGITDPAASAAQHLRHGPQVDVERSARRLAAGRIPHRGRSAARRRAREARRALSPRPIRSPATSRRSGPRSSACAPAFRFPSARSTRTGTRSARACRIGDVVNVVGTSTCIMAISDAAPSWFPASAAWCTGSIHPRLHRHRSGTLGHRRHLRCHRDARRHDGRGACRRAWRTIAPARPGCCA